MVIRLFCSLYANVIIDASVNPALRNFLGSLIFLVGMPSLLPGQVSLVPADHPVYEWLHHQRIMGNASEYTHEMIPLSRGKLADILNNINADNLNGFDKSHLMSYLREIDPEDLLRQSEKSFIRRREGKSAKEFLIDRGKYIISNDEKHLYVHADSASNGVIDLFRGDGFISSSLDRGVYNFLGVRAYASVRNKLGFHIDYLNVAALQNSEVLSSHPVFQNTWSMKVGNKSTIYAQAFGSLQLGKKIRLDLGRGMINYGPGTSNILLSREAPDFDWVRLTWKSKYIDYDYIHGTLQSFGTVTVDSTLANTNLNFNTRLRVDRWLVLRRLTIKPVHWLSFAYSQTNIYSNRGVDLSQLNPFLPVDVSEINNQDLDNPAVYFDAIIRPHRFVEIYGSTSATDLNKRSDIFKRTGNRSSDMVGVFARAAGLNLSYKTGTNAKIEYTQLDPYFYTHKFRFNTYENFNESLGVQFGPNADQWLFSLRQWLPRRSWIQLGFKKVRQGLNILDDEGNLLEDVGGDLFEPQQPGGDKILFLRGDIHQYNQYEIRAQVEPLRALRVNMTFNKRVVTQGTRLNNNDYFEIGLTMGY